MQAFSRSNQLKTRVNLKGRNQYFRAPSRMSALSRTDRRRADVCPREPRPAIMCGAPVPETKGQMEEFSSAVAVLTAMITPAVLISACGALILSTSTRLGRVVDRVRLLIDRFE